MREAYIMGDTPLNTSSPVDGVALVEFPPPPKQTTQTGPKRRGRSVATPQGLLFVRQVRPRVVMLDAGLRLFYDLFKVVSPDYNKTDWRFTRTAAKS